MKYIKSDITPTISKFRTQLYKKLTAPIDAMWELLYIASSQQYLICFEDSAIGYFCVNENNSLIQIFLEESHSGKMNQIIEELIETKLIKSASLSSNEPIAFNTCLFFTKSTQTNTFCFQHINQIQELNSDIKLEEAKTKDIPQIKSFFEEQIGMIDTFGYTENLVARKELFVYRNGEVIIATSECRQSDTQLDYADIGIIVNKEFQGRGIATQIMQIQANNVLRAGRKPICSTTLDNIASRKAIERAGFYCTNIIFDMNFH